MGRDVSPVNCGDNLGTDATRRDECAKLGRLPEPRAGRVQARDVPQVKVTRTHDLGCQVDGDQADIEHRSGRLPVRFHCCECLVQELGSRALRGGLPVLSIRSSTWTVRRQRRLPQARGSWRRPCHESVVEAG
jgi:hypothetical protein